MPENGWDRTADVVVVGLGAAGVAAAISAAEAGASTIALERTGAPGGTSAMSGGILYLGGGTATQRSAGVSDTPTAMTRFLAHVLGRPDTDPRLVAYCAGSVEHHDWLVAHGVRFIGELWPEPGMEPPGTEGLVYSGGEDAAPYAELVAPAARGHVPATPGAAGGVLMEQLTAAMTATGAVAVTDARAERLVVGADGSVTGVVARIDGQQVAVRARGGVVLASGGWAYDDALLDAHLPALRRVAWRLGTDNDDGWGLRAAQQAGGVLESMASVEVAVPITPPRSMVRGVLVDGTGRRFINEDTYFGHIGQEVLTRHDGIAYLLFDEPTHQVNRVGMRAEWVCGDWDELTAELELPPGSLASTMAEYNADAAVGRDRRFDKHPEWLVPLDQPPFGAIDLRVDSALYAGFPLGGIATDTEARVLRDDGELVGGLYAVGRVAASLARARYCSGISLGEGTFFGRRAGRSAAAQR